MHFSPLQITGPSLVLCMACVRQAAAQAGSLQCMHCVLTKTFPFEVLYSFITVRWFSSGFRIPLISFMGTGTGKLFASAQSYSQPWHPLHRVESYKIPWNSESLIFFGDAFSSFPIARETPVIPSTLRSFGGVIPYLIFLLINFLHLN